MANRIQLRRDTAANWDRVNPVLEDGEPGYVTDTDQIKYGDGNTAWRDLAYSGYMKGADITKSIGIETTSGKTGVWLADEALAIFEGEDGLWFSQYGDIIRDYNDDWGGGIAYLSDGNIIVVGGSYAEGYYTDPNMMLLKYSPQGEILWQHGFSEGYGEAWVGDNVWIGRNDKIYATWMHDNNNSEGYIGSFYSEGYIDQRVIYYNGPRADAQALDGWVDPAPNTSYNNDRIYMVGHALHGNDLESGWIRQLSANNLHSVNWSRGINTNFENGHTYFRDVAAHADGAYVCGEGYDNALDNLYPGYQGLVASWDAAGNLLWHLVYKQLETGGGWVGFNDIKIDRNGDLIVSGSWWNATYPSFPDHAVIAKINHTNGEVIWTKRIAAGGVTNSNGSSIAIGAANQIYWMGQTGQRPDQGYVLGLFFMELDTDGNIRWCNTLGGNSNDTQIAYGTGHRELALSPDGTMLATTGYSYVAPGNNSTDYSHMITAQLPADGSRAKTYISRNNLIYAPNDMKLESVNMSSRDLGTSFAIDTYWWSRDWGFSVDDANSFDGYGGRNSELTRFGGAWMFTNGDITLPYGGDILRSDGASAIHTLKVNDQKALGTDYYIQSSDAGGLIYAEGYGYTVYVPKRQNEVDFPVGTVITIVNSGWGGDGVTYITMVDNDTSNNELYCAGTNTNYHTWSLPKNSIATLVKVWNNPNNDYQCKWILSGVGVVQS
jgi:hypothetical protein